MAGVVVSYHYLAPSRLGPAGLALATSSPGTEAAAHLTRAADAVAMTGPVALPAAVVEVAGRKGSSKLVGEARRLAALGGEGLS